MFKNVLRNFKETSSPSFTYISGKMNEMLMVIRINFDESNCGVTLKLADNVGHYCEYIASAFTAVPQIIGCDWNMHGFVDRLFSPEFYLGSELVAPHSWLSLFLSSDESSLGIKGQARL